MTETDRSQTQASVGVLLGACALGFLLGSIVVSRLQRLRFLRINIVPVGGDLTLLVGAEPGASESVAPTEPRRP